MLEMISDCPHLPLQARKTILKELGLALKDRHAGNWIHLDRKRDVAKPRRTTKDGNGEAFGGVFFRTSGKSNLILTETPFLIIWLFPLLFVLTRTEPFNPDFESLSVELEQVILHEVLSNFGPLPDELVKHVDDEKAGEHLKDLWKMIEEDEERAEGYEPFEQWTGADYSNFDNDAKGLMLTLTNLDPGQWAEMVDVTTNPYWVRGWFHGHFGTEEYPEDDAKQKSDSRARNNYSLANICNLRT
ncbi:hypothetical protein BOTNAR_0019g00280 [Botryotinia narcissicola]|uniref:Protein kinase domain-containing protein n=1 Tax=Botryotinia narcissicola TaxID=278944 RepID=A0A4Z1J540_9HELO|nr:hypothetical protein BOTNAR_0019g00280 [Botryotinia narcissicola]